MLQLKDSNPSSLMQLSCVAEGLGLSPLLLRPERHVTQHLQVLGSQIDRSPKRCTALANPEFPNSRAVRSLCKAICLGTYDEPRTTPMK